MALSVRPEILDTLTEGIATLTGSETWRRHLDAQRRFHNYSFGNVVLIQFQFPAATRVGGFNTWLKLNRHVRRGERGIAILAPCVYKSVKDDDDQAEERRVLRGFKVAHVFDVAQTEGEDLPEVCRRLQGDAPGDAFEGLARVAGELGFAVERVAMGSTNGDCNFTLRRIRVSSEVSGRPGGQDPCARASARGPTRERATGSGDGGAGGRERGVHRQLRAGRRLLRVHLRLRGHMGRWRRGRDRRHQGRR